MKSWITLLALCLVAGALMVRPPHTRTTPRVVHADTGCDATSLSGNYAYNVSGFFFDNQGYLNTFSAVGRLTADGQGGLGIKDTISIDGRITRGQEYAGTYTVSSDCSGTITTNSRVAGSLVYDFVFGNNLTELQMIDTDGTNITGSAKKQVIPAPAAPTSSGS